MISSKTFLISIFKVMYSFIPNHNYAHFLFCRSITQNKNKKYIKDSGLTSQNVKKWYMDMNVFEEHGVQNMISF